MKKIFYLCMVSVLFVACSSRRSLDLNRLTTGMNKAEVERIAGLPDRILAVNETNEGYQEVLEYRTSRGEIYALDFWDDYLTGYEYLYEDVQYVPAPYPVVLPPYGRPLYVYPGGAYRPNYNPPGYNRPPNYNRPSNNNRPGNNTNTNRPTVTERNSGSNRGNNNGNSNSNSNSNTNSSTSGRTSGSTRGE